MEFIKYKHIDNTTAEVARGEYFAKYPHLLEETWVVTEKVDGANFQFCTDGVHIQCCSRNRVLTPTCIFHNYQQVFAKYEESVKRAYKKVAADYDDGEQKGPLFVRLYGEIFGGYFPVKESVAKKEGPPAESVKEETGAATASATATESATASAAAVAEMSQDAKRINEDLLKVLIPAGPHVQKRACYSSFIDFYLFDIKYGRCESETEDGEASQTLNMLELLEVASQCGFPLVAKPLRQGTLAEMLELSPEFLTTIPEQLGQPQIPGNVAEGYILRPLHNRTGYRLKMKHEKFAEFLPMDARAKICEEKWSQNRKPKPKPKPKKELPVLTDQEQEVVDEVRAGVTENRMISLVSKCGGRELEKMDDRKMTSLLIDDVLDELLQDRHDPEDLLHTLEKPGIKRVKATVFEEVLDFVKENRSSL